MRVSFNPVATEQMPPLASRCDGQRRREMSRGSKSRATRTGPQKCNGSSFARGADQEIIQHNSVGDGYRGLSRPLCCLWRKAGQKQAALFNCALARQLVTSALRVHAVNLIEQSR